MSTTTTATHPSILLVGDSITQLACDPMQNGFQSLLERDYIRRLDVVNRGLSGYNTRWTLDVLPAILQDAYAHRAAPLLVTVFLGANDAAPPGSTQHVPLPEFQANLRALVELLRQWFPSSKVLLLTPPPISDTRTCGRRNDLARTYAAASVAVGTALDIPVVDLWTLLQEDRDSYLVDGLHLNAKGNMAVYNSLTQHIASLWPHLSPDNLPFVYLPWASNVQSS
ncbi:hypothetical protein H257_11332 [Aphanomyces astaci]|uniref:SGNH hydrolase-type esterase domain-containing protein n=1 Tax=Aphanomyces astaci TaxID=112090 RepID=W4G410_APHAT|nr:hypothetical protein H257_11332 [Aphanomyces astaci]ETV74016.1 hypothetical protein H257_11332 [Aphanomyces astaci]|eukprot:XP_009836529.1 hypothetical protein H257_11332 [Aphanomyces astaci]